ncbi:glycosyltransferase family 2 protein [Dyella tabacisoli]|uniref:glycosyltransferase family 2 protein n=1 Tax=Dyella tabacisoli TaxID=2282381 RepID=UPI0013B3E4AC|nr:glycosyltransferase family 2 protein [Dyella tabacisoli]
MPSIITTIIPTFRRPALLRRAITSALAQDGVSLTVHVFDNASGDETRSLVSELAADDPRLRYQEHERNIGATDNFEFGFKSVETPFFSVLSDDDYLLPGFYQHALDDFAKHPEAIFWAGMTLQVDEKGDIWDVRTDQWPIDGMFLPPEGLMVMMHGKAPIWTGIVFRREILDLIGLPDREALGPSDLDFILRAAASYPFVLRKYPAAVFTLNSASYSATQPLSSFWPGWQKMLLNLETNTSLDGRVKTEALAALHQDARRMLFRRGANALSAGRYDFTLGAAAALHTYYDQRGRAWMLRTLAIACARLPWLQRVYAKAYRTVEHLLVKSRTDLKPRFGHLIRRS